MRLDIFSDPICPWCLIGKAQLDRALEAAPHHPFTVAWHPFRLNPDLPAGGADRTEYLAAKFGGPERVAAMEARVAEAARAAGVEIDFAAIARVPDTLDAHRLIHWAGIEGRQSAVVSALFRAYFREGRDIGDAGVLADIGAGAGLDGDMLARLLASDADRDTVAALAAEAGARGIRAVPTFLIAGAHAVEGAQPADLWAQVIDELAGAPE